VNVLEKLVPIRKRKVKMSNILERKIINNDFSKELISKINEFKNCFEQGEDISSNLSIGVFDGNYWDCILNSWNVRHLHLSRRTEFSGKSMKKIERIIFCFLCLMMIIFIL